VDLMKFLLRVEEVARHGIVQQGVTVLFERGNFLAAQRQGALLFFLERLAFGHQAFILSARFFIRGKAFNALARRAHFRLVQDRLAQLDGFLLDHAILCRRLHKINCSERHNTSQLRRKSKCFPENFAGTLRAADAGVHRPALQHQPFPTLPVISLTRQNRLPIHSAMIVS
jgi:hypothetical protein